MTKEEKAQSDAAVKTEVEKIIVAHQQQFAQTLQTVMKDALDNVDKTNETLIAARNALAKELDAAKEERAKAEKEGEKMAQLISKTNKNSLSKPPAPSCSATLR